MSLSRENEERKIEEEVIEEGLLIELEASPLIENKEKKNDNPTVLERSDENMLEFEDRLEINPKRSPPVKRKLIFSHSGKKKRRPKPKPEIASTKIEGKLKKTRKKKFPFCFLALD